jgi:hemolysin activation/secretion protein
VLENIGFMDSLARYIPVAAPYLHACTLRLACAFCLGLLIMPVSAQQNGGGSVTAGQVEKRIEETVTDRDRQDDRVRKAPQRTVGAPQPGIVAAPPHIEFTLAAVSISGATVFTPAELAPFYEPYLATPITEVEATEIARRITEKYVAAGYILSRAIVPPQQVVTGVLQLRVIEGYVGAVTVSGLDPE